MFPSFDAVGCNVLVGSKMIEVISPRPGGHDVDFEQRQMNKPDSAAGLAHMWPYELAMLAKHDCPD